MPGVRVVASGRKERLTELQLLENYLALNLFSWFRADNIVNVAGKLGSWNDKVADGVGARAIDAAHMLNQASGPNQCALPVVSAAVNNRALAQFVKATPTFYASTLAASNWSFLHNGAGFRAWAVIVPTLGGAGVDTIFGTLRQQDITAAHGTTFYVVDASAGDPLTLAIGRAAATLTVNVTTGASGLSASTGAIVSCSYIEGVSPEYVIARGNTTLSSGNSAAAPTATAPANTLRIGINAGTNENAFNGGIAELIFANTVSTTLSSSVARYLLLRYGLS